MRPYVTLLLISITFTGCSNEPEQPAQSPEQDISADTASSPSENKLPVSTDRTLKTGKTTSEPRKPLDLSITEDELLEHWNWDEADKWDERHQEKANLFEGKDLFRKNKQEDRMRITALPSFNLKEDGDLSELEIDGGEVNIEVKTR